MEYITFSLKQIELLFETIKILIPVSTGFIVLVVSGLKLLIDKKVSITKIEKKLFLLILVGTVIAIGLWSGSLAFLIDCANTFGRMENNFNLNISQLNWEYKMGQLCAQIAHLSFFISIIIFCILSYKLFLGGEFSNEE